MEFDKHICLEELSAEKQGIKRSNIYSHKFRRSLSKSGKNINKNKMQDLLSKKFKRKKSEKRKRKRSKKR